MRYKSAAPTRPVPSSLVGGMLQEHVDSDPQYHEAHAFSLNDRTA
jgi:hypothetical protein